MKLDDALVKIAKNIKNDLDQSDETSKSKFDDVATSKEDQSHSIKRNAMNWGTKYKCALSLWMSLPLGMTDCFIGIRKRYSPSDEYSRLYHSALRDYYMPEDTRKKILGSFVQWIQMAKKTSKARSQEPKKEANVGRMKS